MLPGPDLIYECPNCETPVRKHSLASGNTFGADFFSDGKCIAPMLPEFPRITRCKKCRQIFWISRLSPVAKYEIGETKDAKHAAAKTADFLKLEDYLEVLQNHIYRDAEEAIFVRKNLWWLFNDPIRRGKAEQPDAKWMARWEDNCRRLNALLDEDNGGHSLIKAELHRNLGEFAQSLAILARIGNDEYSWVIPQLRRACERQHRYVIQLET